jgi:hypothetical protein
MIDGKWIVRNGRSKIYDEKEIRNDAGSELKKLLGRV